MNISESLDRLLDSNQVFGESFYEVFLNCYPEVQKYFDGVDMQRQAILLTMALTIVEQFYCNEQRATKTYLQYMGAKHNGWHIPPELFSQWREAMLGTLFQFHREDWDQQLATQWREAIDHAIEVMLTGYEQTVPV